MDQPHIILASASPRRKELLEQIWLAADIFPADIDETPLPDEEVIDYVSRLSFAKAEVVAKKYPDSFVLAADTIVVSAKGELLGKPRSDEDAARMLRILQNTVHIVATGFSIICQSQKKNYNQVVETKVEMVGLNADEIESYVLTGEPKGKAGAYAIQGAGTGFVKSISGSYSNVVGLPLAEVVSALQELGAVESKL